MNTLKQKEYKALWLILVLASCVFCICQDTNAVNQKDFNKEFTNTTGIDINGISFAFVGPTIDKLQDATLNTSNNQGFQAPTYDLYIDWHILTWKGECGNDPAKKIQVGVSVDADKLPPWFKCQHVFLTKDEQFIKKIPVCAKPEVVYVSEEFVGIDITSPVDDPNITVDEVKYAFIPDPIPLEMLNGDNADITWIPIPAPPAEGLKFNPDQTIRVAEVVVSPGSHIVVSARVSFTDDSELGAGHVFFQSEVPQPPEGNHPTVSQWGLIVMALLLVTVGAIIIRKRRLVRVWVST